MDLSFLTILGAHGMVWNGLKWFDIPSSLYGTINRRLHILPLVSLMGSVDWWRHLLHSLLSSSVFLQLSRTSFKTKTLSLIQLQGLLALKIACWCVCHFYRWVEDKGTEIATGMKISHSFFLLPFIYFQLCISEHWNNENNFDTIKARSEFHFRNMDEGQRYEKIHIGTNQSNYSHVSERSLFLLPCSIQSPPSVLFKVPRANQKIQKHIFFF